MSREYSKEELEEMRKFERMMWVSSVEQGKLLTDKQYEAIRYFLGDMIDAAKAIPTKTVTIHFDKSGLAHSIDNDGIIESVNGKKL